MQTTSLLLYDAKRFEPVKHPGKYTWTLNNAIGAGVVRSRLSLKYLSMWYTWYVFKNEVLTYNDGAPQTIILNGTFNDVTLPAYIQTLLGGGYTVMINPNTMTINIISPGLVTWTAAGTATEAPWSARLKYFLGLETNLGPTLNASFPYPVKLGGDMMIQIKFGNMISQNTNEANSSNMLTDSLKIPVPVNGFEFIEYSPDNFYTMITAGQNNSYNLTVTFLDQFGNELDLNNGDAVFIFTIS